MKKIKRTTQADIDKKISVFNGILKDLTDLENLRSVVASRLDIIFSEDCSECNQQAGFIKATRELFQSSGVYGLADSLYSFNQCLQPNSMFPLLDDETLNN